ncbi:CDP-glycerol glycerophosphotransferase family protein [Spongisporangium articulatum]|uniref:CDP-glycerol glycerophosphotransferase family protein n=1 Tax=Spongisporangium articulatum TaxID=3362603 RepID=A0ABW8AQI1_9ACTN
MYVPVTVSNFLRSPNRGTAAAMANAVRNKQRARRRLARAANRVDREPPGPAPAAEVIVYFADDPRKLYQLDQWLPVLAELHKRHQVLIALRKMDSLLDLRARTFIPSVYVRRLADLLELYDELEPKVAIYVNNGVANFQSLAVSTMLHVHVNHGESDKVSMVSNQAKSYDRVFVAGEAAERRHAAALIDFDQRKLVRVGRPQLDLTFPPQLPPTTRRTVMYAPTWEGENDFNNYTSVDVYGPAIVSQLLDLPDVRLVYRPHPRVLTSTDPGVAAGHQEILRLLEAADRRDPGAGHTSSMEGNTLALFGHADAMVTDVSSIGLDFLYLRTEKPLFIADRRNDRDLLAVDAPISAACDVIDAGTIATLGATVAARLDSDQRLSSRQELRQFYFGDLAPGESTERFLAAVSEVIAQRDRLIQGMAHPHGGSSAAAAAGDLGDDDSPASFQGHGALASAGETAQD